VRKNFAGISKTVTADQVAKVREQIKTRNTSWSAQELLGTPVAE
jgi:hypothetical protein